jgi:hypothetical protein
VNVVTILAHWRDDETRAGGLELPRLQRVIALTAVAYLKRGVGVVNLHRLLRSPVFGDDPTALAPT